MSDENDRVLMCSTGDELRKLVAENKELLDLPIDELCKRQCFIEETDLRWVVDQCVPSKLIREYLISYPPAKKSLSWLIRNAQIPLSRKAVLFDHLRECEDLPAALCYATKRCLEYEQNDPTWLDWDLESIVNDSFSQQYRDIKEALRELKLESGEIFTWTWFDFDEDCLETLEIDNRPFSSFDEAIEHIRRLVAFGQIDSDWLSWFALSKWVPDENGKLQQSYRYVLIQDEVIFFEKPRAKDNRRLKASRRFFGSGNRLGYSDWPGFPFRNGDLFTIDFRPFAPPVHALMIDDLSHLADDDPIVSKEAFDPRAMIACPDTLRNTIAHIEWDPNHKQCDITCEWSLGGSINFFHDQNPLCIDYMPYGRLDACAPDELAEDEKILLEVQKFIRKDPKHGPLLFRLAEEDNLCTSKLSEDELRELLTSASSWLKQHGD